MKRTRLRWMPGVAGMLAGLCVGAIPGSQGQIAEVPPGGGEREGPAPVWVMQGNAWKEAPHAVTSLKGLIRLDVMVRDTAGNAVPGLRQEDLTVLDNGQPETIVAFQPSAAAGGAGGPSPEVSIVVLLDTLALPPQLAAEERQQVVAFLRADGGRLRWPVTVYTFEDSGFYLTAKASRDGIALAEAVVADGRSDRLVLRKAPGSPYALNPFNGDEVQRHLPLRQRNAEISPLTTGVQALATIAAAEDGVPGRKVLLWVGPGLRDKGTGAYADEAYEKLVWSLNHPGALVGSYTPPEVTDASVRQAIFYGAYWLLTLLRQARMTVDVFSAGEQDWRRTYRGRLLTSIPELKDREARWLQVLHAWKPYEDGLSGPEQAKEIDFYKKVLAVESGGRVLADEKDIARQMAECVRGSDVYYTLTFDPVPARHADDLHTLEVKARSPQLSAETVRKYYDEPYYHDPPYGGSRPLPVSGLHSLLRAARGGSEQARLLEQVMLTERVTVPDRAKLRAELHGGKPQETLEALADEAEFEPPPGSEALADPAPGAAEQQQILGRAQQYLEETIPTLPDFFAVRQAERFTSTAAFHEQSTSIVEMPVHRTETWKANVLYRQGREMALAKVHAGDGTRKSLQTYGTFGPVLFTLRSALGYTQGVSWSRWERGTMGREAVFAFAVPNTVPHQYSVIGCCVPDAAGDVWFKLTPGYHGEVTIDEQTGVILRIQVEAELAGFAAVEHSAVMVAYGPVTIGARTYSLPLRSVSLWRGRSMAVLQDWNLSFRTWGPEQTTMEVFTFDHYRMFRSSVRMLPGSEPMGKEPH